MTENKARMAAGGAVVGLVVVGVWAISYAIADEYVPAGFEGEHLQRSLTAWMALAVAGSLIAGALLARRLHFQQPWLFAMWGQVFAGIVVFCGFVATRAAPDGVGGVILVAGVVGVYAGLAALADRVDDQNR